jgi:transposase
MYYATSIGLDVHLSTISACAFVSDTGEFIPKTFKGDDIEGIARWAKSLTCPVQAVYESGFCGFTLQRELERYGVVCKIAAISKLAKPSGDKIKTDKRDARFLAVQLACGNVTCITVPSIEREGMRDISRALGIARDNLTASKLRVIQTHYRYGLRFSGDKRPWTLSWLSWAKKVKLPSKAAQVAYDHHLTHAFCLIDEKASLQKEVEKYCEQECIRDLVQAFCAIKGISKTIAFALAVEIGTFSRFKTAAGFASFLGLVPSESSSGQTKSKGGITHTGNEHIRKHLIEAAWVYCRVATPYKKAPAQLPAQVRALAFKANKKIFEKRNRLKKVKHACVANAASAREMATWIWDIAKTVELRAQLA